MLIPTTILAQNTRKVTGTVMDETDEALIGATVTESGSAKGVITDLDGNIKQIQRDIQPTTEHDILRKEGCAECTALI